MAAPAASCRAGDSLTTAAIARAVDCVAARRAKQPPRRRRGGRRGRPLPDRPGRAIVLPAVTAVSAKESCGWQTSGGQERKAWVSGGRSQDDCFDFGVRRRRAIALATQERSAIAIADAGPAFMATNAVARRRPPRTRKSRLADARWFSPPAPCPRSTSPSSPSRSRAARAPSRVVVIVRDGCAALRSGVAGSSSRCAAKRESRCRSLPQHATMCRGGSA